MDIGTTSLKSYTIHRYDETFGWQTPYIILKSLTSDIEMRSQVQKQNRRNLSVYAGLRRSFCMA